MVTFRSAEEVSADTLLSLIHRARQPDNGWAYSDDDREYARELLDMFLDGLGARVAALPDGYLDGESPDA